MPKIIDLVTKDHRDVEALFERFRRTSEAPSSSTATSSFGEVGSCPATPLQGRIQ